MKKEYPDGTSIVYIGTGTYREFIKDGVWHSAEMFGQALYGSAPLNAQGAEVSLHFWSCTLGTVA
jgi:hypothetical protein